jgi:hypothetical protein
MRTEATFHRRCRHHHGDIIADERIICICEGAASRCMQIGNANCEPTKRILTRDFLAAR